MTKTQTPRNQRGFFALGLGIALSVLFGAISVVDSTRSSRQSEPAAESSAEHRTDKEQDLSMTERQNHASNNDR